MLAKITGNKMILGAVVGIVGGLILTVVLVVVMGVGRSTPTPTADAAAKPGEKPAAGAPAKATAKPAAAAKAGAAPATEAKFGPTYVIRDRIVNLADPGGRRYLRFSVAIEFAAHETAASLAPSEQPSSNQLMSYDSAEDGDGYQLVTEGKDPDKAFQAHVKKYAPAIEDVVTS